MAMFNAYISGIGNISPQKTADNSRFLDEPVITEGTRLKCQEPVYKEYISGDLVRRMSRIIKMGVSASKICMADAGCEMPDAIITGTGLGCVEDTEKFLSTLIRNKEEFLTPTSFIQSTHNTVGAQIALLMKCHNYNFTYVHRGFSFESALVDALSQMQLGQISTALIGGFDEMTDNTFRIMNRMGHFRRKAVLNTELFTNTLRGSIAGEGAAFFLLSSEKGEKDYGKIRDLKMILKPANNSEVRDKLDIFLLSNGLRASDIDLAILGFSGDKTLDKPYDELYQKMMPGTNVAAFKHLCGEYHTASAFGVWLAAMILKTGIVPEIARFNRIKEKPVRNILLYNHYRNLDHSFILLGKD